MEDGSLLCDACCWKCGIFQVVVGLDGEWEFVDCDLKDYNFRRDRRDL